MSATKLRTKDITYCAIGATLITACSWISIPSNVPFTMQTFGVFVTLLILGGKLGTLSILTYLSLGAVGVPVFSGFSGGISILLGPTGGYLIGFLIISVLYSLFIKFPFKKIILDIIILILGLFACYFSGTLQFVLIYSKNVAEISFISALGMCVFPFIIPDLVKLALAVLFAKNVRSYIQN